MKKYLLLGAILMFVVAAIAQTGIQHVGKPDKTLSEVVSNQVMPLNKPISEPTTSINKHGMAITVKPTGGTSGNAYGLYAGGKTAIWADPSLNSIAFIHRSLNPSSGHLAVDVSTDGGSTWQGNLGPIYNPDNVTDFNARYPQGVIYNPKGNTNPDNAYFVAMAPTLDQSNGGSWGGICFVTAKYDTTATPKQYSLTSNAQFHHLIPTAMTINSDGDVLGVDATRINAEDYNDTLILYKGNWNTTNEEMDFTPELLYFYTSAANQLSTNEKSYPVEIKAAFHPTDPNIGYIALIGHCDINIVPDEGYYPIVLKTTDGGKTWSAPINIPLNNFGDLTSEDFIFDSELADIFAPNPVPNRTDLWFRTAFDLDLVVDGDGNPHIVTTVCLGDNGAGLTSFSIRSGGYVKGMFDIWSPDGGNTWNAKFLSRLHTFRGKWGDISEDNRPQASTTPDGSLVFFSWNDTDTNTFIGETENINPDIFVIGFDPLNDFITPVYNVTAGTSADGAAYQGTMPQFVFANAGTYTIPLVYQDFDPSDPTQPATFYYIDGMVIKDADFTSSINELNKHNVYVSQNYPNPFSGLTNVDVNLPQAANMSIVINNLMGQTVYSKDYGFVSAGVHKLEVGVNLKSGIYTYTVQAGNSIVTKKMIVK